MLPLMRAYLPLLLLLWCFVGTASHDSSREDVWVDGDALYKSLKHRKKSTLYFREWSGYADQFLKDENYYVALQLDKTFDPLPKDDIALPSLVSLAAIGDTDLKKEYFQFLERFGRTHGIQYMVLPDTLGVNTLEKQTLVLANRLSPYYFIHKGTLSHQLPTSKKKFISEREVAPTIWVTDPHKDFTRLFKWKKNIHDDSWDSFYEALKKARDSKFIPAYALPPALATALFTMGVVAVDSNNTLPIRKDTITFLGSNTQLKNILQRYAKVFDYRLPNVPCIVDTRSYDGDFQNTDILIRQTIARDNKTSLVLPEIQISNEEIIVAKMLFGAHKVLGESMHPYAKKIDQPTVLGYATPQYEGMDDTFMLRLDTLAAEAIKKMATPGMQVAVVKNGSIVFEKAYGFYTYDSLRAVTLSTLYDLASVTKVMATLPAIALLLDQGKIHLDDTLGQHLPLFQHSNKSGITLRQLLAHQGGLKAYVPFWSMFMSGDRLDAFYYKDAEDEAQDIRTYGLEPHPAMLDTLKSYIVKSPLLKNPDAYHYSDLGFMILHLLVEEVSGLPFDVFLKQNFYEPMGLKHITFNPVRNGISPTDIAPTEYDMRFRRYLVWGEVHDRNAAVFGGVAGHSGLFANASDLAKMMYMFLNGGYYGGNQYLSSETLHELNMRHFEGNRRGLGWDKKGGDKDSASIWASDESFGHTGFTGTMVWADPQQDLIFVFLSNRIFPDAENWKLSTLNTRTHMHDTLYHSLEKTDLRNQKSFHEVNNP